MRRRVSLQQNLINHVVFVLDGSASMGMGGKGKELIAVADSLISFLKEKSQKYNQETRATIYVFGDDTQALCYDVDVLRTPTIANFYEATGHSTALIDATAKAIEDLKKSATVYGDHAFLMYVLTDGQENSSRMSPQLLRSELQRLPENWTVAALVPDTYGQKYATQMGFHLENTAIWDASSAEGVVEVGQKIQEATDNYYVARSQGTRGTRSLFQPTVQNLSPTSVSTHLTRLDPTKYTEFEVTGSKEVIRDAVEKRGLGPYKQGSTFYKLTKSETVQPQKQIAIKDRNNGEIFTGAAARQLLGLPNDYATVVPAYHPNYEIFVQSTSSNRKLIGGTTAIVVR